MDGLSRLIIEDKKQGRLKGVKIIEVIILSHILFLDDILILFNGKISDSILFNPTFKLF